VHGEAWLGVPRLMASVIRCNEGQTKPFRETTTVCELEDIKSTSFTFRLTFYLAINPL
jgi:hypothetical protein